jgi:hypothetical protein
VVAGGGQVWTWGENTYGQLGTRNYADSATPVQVSNLSGVTQVAAGEDHTVALTGEGQVWAWGLNMDGQLGNGATTESSTPVQVAGPANPTQIAGGDYHTVALANDGKVWVWGAGDVGQLGNVTAVLPWSATPVKGAGVNLATDYVAAGTPSISGNARVGATLTADPGAWAPAGVSLAYQWLRDGVAIAGAMARAYTLVAEDEGTRMSVTGSLAGYATVSKTSTQTAAVAPAYAPVMSAFALSPDMTGDGRGEVLAVDLSGRLRLFPGTVSGFNPAHTLPGPAGLAGSRIYGPGDWSNDKKADLAVIDQRGDLWLHQGDGRGKLSAGRVKLGNGWSTFMAVPAGDLTGDGQPDLLGVDLATGLLYLYKWRAADGRFLTRVRVGNGWLGWQLHAAGDLNGDGRGDILGIDARGDLYCYPGKGDGTFFSKKKCGNGWGTYQLVAGSDLTGDKYADIVGRDNATGAVYFYKGQGQGQFATRKQAATGW